MAKRPLGRSGLSISPFVFGGNVFGWTADKQRSFELLDRFVEAGFETIDTADMYSTWVPGNSGGDSETIIGEWLASRGKRDQLIIITKVGMEMPDGQGLSAQWIERAVNDSLRRLQVDHIDLYFSHIYDEETPLDETLTAYDKLIQAGKVRNIGASNHSAEQLQQALAMSKQLGVARYEVLQPEYNLYDRTSFEGPLQDLAMNENLGVITYFSLASGFLSGKYRSTADLDQSPRGEGISKYLNDRGFAILQALDEVAANHQASPAEVALAWVMAQKGVSAPIASATRLEQLENLIRAAQLSLSAEELKQLNGASAI